MHCMIKQFSGSDQAHTVGVEGKGHSTATTTHFLSSLSCFPLSSNLFPEAIHQRAFKNLSITSETKPTVCPGTALTTTITIHLMFF